MAVELVLTELRGFSFPVEGVEQVAASGDLRLLWFLSDISWLFGFEGRSRVATAAAALSGASRPEPRTAQLRDWLFA